MADRKDIVIIGGGTVDWVAPHLAVAAPAYGTTAIKLEELCREIIPEMDRTLYLTKMALGHKCFSQDLVLETNADIAHLVDRIIKDDVTKIVFFTVAMVDFSLQLDHQIPKGKNAPRIPSNNSYPARLCGLPKVIGNIRKTRKDIFLVGFKQTSGATEDEQYIAALDLCKKASCNLVFANDRKTRVNMIVTPEEARYHMTKDRDEALRGLVIMAKLRSHLTFTRSTVVAGDPISWDSPLVPDALRQVVDHCITSGAYKPFNGSTVGHFACKLDDTTFLTSQRRTDFNDLHDIGLVKIKTDGPDTVVAYGAKPSVGGQSQRIVFKDHPGLDCIVHFHSPLRDLNDPDIPQVSQYEFECGSHECGRNTSNGLKQIGNLWVVYLKEHGPNIVFNRNIDPKEVTDFIDQHFDLSQKTGGFVSIKQRLATPDTLDDFRRITG